MVGKSRNYTFRNQNKQRYHAEEYFVWSLRVCLRLCEDNLEAKEPWFPVLVGKHNTRQFGLQMRYLCDRFTPLEFSPFTIFSIRGLASIALVQLVSPLSHKLL
jgi:hypothetical protein